MRERLEESGDLGNLEAARVITRAFRYMGPFKGPFTVKAVLTVVSLLPLLFLPWPVKIIVDHVVEGVPIGEQQVPYPPFMSPLIDFLAPMDPMGILFTMIAIQMGLLVLLGAVGTGGAERDQADAYLSSGHDQATRTENEANAGFSMTSGLLGLFDFRYTIRLTQRLNHYYRSRLFERIQSLPMTAFDDERIGDAVFRVMYDTPSITNGTYRMLLTPIGSLIFGAATVYMLRLTYGNHPEILWTAVAMLATALVATFPFSGALRRRSGSSRRAGSTTTSTMEEGLSNILAVQSLGGEDRERTRFDDDSWESFGRFRAQMKMGMIASAVAIIPGLAITSYGFYYVSNLVIEDQISVGDWGLLFTYFLMLAFSCIEIGALWIRVQESAVGLNRVFFLMDLPGEQDHPGAAPMARLTQQVSFEGVDYDYPDGTAALREIDLVAPVGEITALVGQAGAGKTTLAYLLPRFVSPSRGTVRFDGVDLESGSLDSIRSQVAFVFQETVLFDATVEENIRMGNPAADDTAVRRAAQIAGADEFIRDLPDGYRTRLGRAGGKLSVGQKQRLSIARALVRDASILILDEPTSALDPATEMRLVAALREASKTRVVLVIAHRLSTIRSADQILVVDAGRIVERGSHSELMERPQGAYRRFVELQTRGAA